MWVKAFVAGTVQWRPSLLWSRNA